MVTRIFSPEDWLVLLAAILLGLAAFTYLIEGTRVGEITVREAWDYIADALWR